MMEYTVFGESHGPAVGVLIQNIPAGLPVDETLIRADLLRRKAFGELATGRHEPDEVEFLSGVYQGRTTGDALVAVLRNRDVRSADYAPLRDTPRPGHADYAAFVRSGGHAGHGAADLAAHAVAAFTGLGGPLTQNFFV